MAQEFTARFQVPDPKGLEFVKADRPYLTHDGARREARRRGEMIMAERLVAAGLFLAPAIIVAAPAVGAILASLIWTAAMAATEYSLRIDRKKWLGY